MKTRKPKTKVTERLPADLLQEIQKYIQGESIYIPKPKAAYKKWGENSGGRKHTADRNQQIRALFQSGMNIEQLADHYHLSVETIKKIVYVKRNTKV